MKLNNVLIIAEAGVNHNGELQKAIELIDAAAHAKADYVKFQTFKAEKIVNPTAKKAQYQVTNMQGEGDTQFEMLKKLEMGDDWYPILIQRCQEKGIHFLSTGFDQDSIDFLNDFEIPFYKIPSGEITNKPYLQHIARKGKDIILSTGMADLKEVKEAIEVIEAEGITRNRITVLHCNTEYPTPMQDVNLLAMNQMAEKLGVQIGYSDHTLGIEVPIAAVALGAKVIEKHFTLDRNLPGPDHAAHAMSGCAAPGSSGYRATDPNAGEASPQIWQRPAGRAPPGEVGQSRCRRSLPAGLVGADLAAPPSGTGVCRP